MLHLETEATHFPQCNSENGITLINSPSKRWIETM